MQDGDWFAILDADEVYAEALQPVLDEAVREGASSSSASQRSSTSPTPKTAMVFKPCQTSHSAAPSLPGQLWRAPRIPGMHPTPRYSGCGRTKSQV